jgi:hypothetical protein
MPIVMLFITQSVDRLPVYAAKKQHKHAKIYMILTITELDIFWL